jgi:PilZ domain
MEVEEAAECPKRLDGERRGMPRCAVDEEAVLLLVGHGGWVKCRIVEMSLAGCRISTMERLPAGSGHRVEAVFKLRGVAFRFIGVAEWTDGLNLVGIRFVDMPTRRRDELAEVLCEMAAENAAEEEKAAAEKRVAEKPARTPQADVDHAAAKQSGLEPQQAALEPVGPPPAPSDRPVMRERRQQSRHEVDTSAVILLINVGSLLRGRIVDLSLSGCRIRTEERFPVGIYTRVETEFRIGGLPFRLGGVIQSVHDRDRHNVGIRFLDVSARKRGHLEQLIEEIEELRARKALAKTGEFGLESHRP